MEETKKLIFLAFIFATLITPSIVSAEIYTIPLTEPCYDKNEIYSTKPNYQECDYVWIHGVPFSYEYGDFGENILLFVHWNGNSRGQSIGEGFPIDYTCSVFEGTDSPCPLENYDVIIKEATSSKVVIEVKGGPLPLKYLYGLIGVIALFLIIRVWGTVEVRGGKMEAWRKKIKSNKVSWIALFIFALLFMYVPTLPETTPYRTTILILPFVLLVLYGLIVIPDPDFLKGTFFDRGWVVRKLFVFGVAWPRVLTSVVNVFSHHDLSPYPEKGEKRKFQLFIVINFVFFSIVLITLSGIGVLFWLLPYLSDSFLDVSSTVGLGMLFFSVHLYHALGIVYVVMYVMNIKAKSTLSLVFTFIVAYLGYIVYLSYRMFLISR